VFLKATGFNDAQEARYDMRKSRCLAKFQETSRSREDRAMEHIGEIKEELLLVIPGLERSICAVAAEF
jgi:hypothetical protein